MTFVDIEHVILGITLVILLVAFSPLFLNVMSTLNTSLNNNVTNHLGNTDPVVSIIQSNSSGMTIISITIMNNESKQLMIYGVEMANLMCNLTPSMIVIPPNGKGTITLLITNAVNGIDSITINLGGDAYSTFPGAPALFCLNGNINLPNNEIILTTNNGDIYINTNFND